MGLLERLEQSLSAPARRLGHALRFWGEITRGVEKWVTLSRGHFCIVFWASLPRAFHPKARSHDPITGLGFVVECY
jgi:hypothetical protein